MTGLHPNITLLSCSTSKTPILEEAAVLPSSTYMTSQMPMIGQGCCDWQGYIPSTQRAQSFALSYSQPWVDAEFMSRWWGERLFLVLVENPKWLWFWEKKISHYPYTLSREKQMNKNKSDRASASSLVQQEMVFGIATIHCSHSIEVEPCSV